MSHGVYVHVPWCRIRCPYCNFYVLRDTADKPEDAFVSRVLRDADALQAAFPGPRRTVYLGGGTPSRLSPDALSALLHGLVRPETEEISVEANPEDLSEAWLQAALDAGVNRVSLGVQTFHPGHARTLGRAHTPAEAHKALALLQQADLRSFSADLMFGLHAQTLPELQEDLRTLLSYGPHHISLYGLTVEPGTGYARAAERGRIEPAGDDLWRQMYAWLVDAMQAEGIERYEVSNFAQPGHRSLHNSGYWTGRPYMGLGPGAHGQLPDGRRWANPEDLSAWIGREDARGSAEHLDAESAATDLLLTRLRTTAGLSLAELTGATALTLPADRLALLARHGLLLVDGDHIRLGPEGWFVADGVVRQLSAWLVPA